MSDASGDEIPPRYDIEDMLASTGFHRATEWEQEFLEEMKNTEPSPAQEKKLEEIQQEFWCIYEPMQTASNKYL